MSTNIDNGVISIRSHHPVVESVERLQKLLAARGIKLFALIDHSGEAESAGLSMRPCKLLVFGNPKAGTPLMIAAPTVAIDLPLKILIWEDADGQVWISYNDSAYLQHRHGLSSELIPNIAAAGSLAVIVAE